MAICINCGNEGEGCLCAECRRIVDIEKLCDYIIFYKPGEGKNELWDKISGELIKPYNFRNVAFALADGLLTPRKEFVKIKSIAGGSVGVPKSSRKWLYSIAPICVDSEMTDYEKSRVRGFILDALYKDYFFKEADEMADKLLEEKKLPKQVYMTLGDFYTKTRRYDMAEEILVSALDVFPDEYMLKKLLEDNKKQREKAETGKAEYMPNPRENKQEVREKYIAFLAGIGIEAEKPQMKKKTPVPIAKDQYPIPVETRYANFDSFVAFDLETTGKNSVYDSIIEIGAVKVVNGEVSETAEFVFQEFVKPYDRRISDEISQLTGITEDDVKNARQMWEVFPDFMRFAGDDVLVGFNCISFDSKFMVRAGRYSNLITENKYFDVMRYADKFRNELEIEEKGIKLELLCEKLGIENSQAHRALADAVATARIYLKLKSMDSTENNTSVDDVLADLDEW